MLVIIQGYLEHVSLWQSVTQSLKCLTKYVLLMAMVFENSNFNVTNFLNITSHLCLKYRKLTQKENTNSSFVEKLVLSINTIYAPGSVPGASLHYAHQQPHYAHSKFCSLSEGKSSPSRMAGMTMARELLGCLRGMTAPVTLGL